MSSASMLGKHPIISVVHVRMEVLGSRTECQREVCCDCVLIRAFLHPSLGELFEVFYVNAVSF